MHSVLVRLAVIAALALLAPAWAQAESLLLCGGKEVFLIDTAQAEKAQAEKGQAEKGQAEKGQAEKGQAEKGAVQKLWSWQALQRKDLPPAITRRFATTDDCKPIDDGAKVLVSSSSGGCALVERPSGRVLWYAAAPNAHSLELLPENRVVVACSTNPQGNRLMVFALTQSDKPLYETPLPSAHGVVWDDARKCLWALGYDKLYRYTLKNWNSAQPELALDKTFALPDTGGHDLQAVPHGPDLVLSTSHHVYLFNRDQAAFRLHPVLGNVPHMKCVSIHPVTGRTVYLHDNGKNWWNDELGLLSPAGKMTLPGERLYKGRWLVAPAK